MRNITLILLSIFCWGSFSCASELTSLEGLVEQWVGLQSEITEEKKAWKRQQQQWNQEIALLEEESRKLDELIDQEKALTLDKEGVTARQLERKTQLQSTVDEVGQTADRTTALILDMKQWIPESLKSEILLRGCDAINTEGVASTRRLQNLLSTLSEIENIKHRTHVVRELITVEGGVRREMDVVYIGLAAAYAVSPDNSVAAIGYPTATGWKWAKSQGLAPEVRKLVGIKQQKLPPALVNLPMSRKPVEVNRD